MDKDGKNKEIGTGSSHITKPEDNLFLNLGFPLEAAIGYQNESKERIAILLAAVEKEREASDLDALDGTRQDTKQTTAGAALRIHLETMSTAEIAEVVLNGADDFLPEEESQSTAVPAFRLASEVKAFDFEEWSRRTGFKKR